MRILIAMPHYCEIKNAPQRRSEETPPAERARLLEANLTALHLTFGRNQVYLGKPQERCNGAVTNDIDIVVCTTGGSHSLQHVDPQLFVHQQTAAEPEELGYECHAVLADNFGKYDMYCYMEDDLLITDPLFFWKIGWFTTAAGDLALLQPNRFELSSANILRKTYIDGPLVNKAMAGRFQTKGTRQRLTGTLLGQAVRFERVDNPHAGCFFLNQSQMRRWVDQPYFLDRSAEFMGALEGAATLGVMRTFNIYKPSIVNASFLEVRHLDPRYRWKQQVWRGRDETEGGARSQAGG